MEISASKKSDKVEIQNLAKVKVAQMLIDFTLTRYPPSV